MLLEAIPIKEIAKEVNTSCSNLSLFINRHNLQKLNLFLEKKEKIKAMMIQGISRKEIAEEMNISVKNLNGFICKQNLKKEIENEQKALE